MGGNQLGNFPVEVAREIPADDPVYKNFSPLFRGVLLMRLSTQKMADCFQTELRN